MVKWLLAAGAAALAISAPTLADSKDNKGGGNKGQSGHVAKADRGGGGGAQKARGSDKARGQTLRAAQADNRGRGGGKEIQAAKRDDRAGRRDAVRVDNRGNDKNRSARIEDNRGRGQGRGDDVRTARVDRDVRNVRIDRDDDDLRFIPRWNERGLASGFINGCPPGLAKKGNGCLPPGQAKKIVGTRFSQALGLSALSGPYREWYRDDDRFIYRWDDDNYVYRINRENSLIDALFPLSNRDYYYYPVGMQYPDYYNYYNVPYQYQSFYPDGGDYLYRYGDGAIYMVDPQTQMISGIASLLTGNPLSIGQPLPASYGVYNVPLSYRDRYYDSPDAWYRYNDGYIYRVDPTTQLISAVINALV